MHFNIKNIMILKKKWWKWHAACLYVYVVIYRISTDKRTNIGRMTKIIKNEIKIRELSLE